MLPAGPTRIWLGSNNPSLHQTQGVSITCVGRSLVPGGHTHITQVGTDFGRRGWEINQLVQRLAAGDTFYVKAPGKGRSLAFFDKCACTFESIRTIEGAYQSVDHLDAVPLCT